ncbi:MAG: hypothetical protein PHT16_02950 [Candidatus Pacebacteria bacterium]|nr:hypothetical protein [Candidatus Paceibacterota bacterium]
MNKTTLLVVGIILAVVGIIGLMMSFSSTWMWVLIVLGVIGVIWGLMKKDKMM